MTRESSREWQLGYQQAAEARAPGTGAASALSGVSGSGSQPRCHTGQAERPTTSGKRRLRSGGWSPTCYNVAWPKGETPALLVQAAKLGQASSRPICSHSGSAIAFAPIPTTTQLRQQPGAASTAGPKVVYHARPVHILSR